MNLIQNTGAGNFHGITIVAPRKFVCLFIFSSLFLLAPKKSGAQDFKIVFWNLENFFDTRDDPLTSDDEYTPMGEKHWSRKKFNEKRNGLAKAILLLSGGELPSLIGVAEAENRYVLRQLTEATALSPAGYGIIHKDSPDSRGIDVALLYRKERFSPLKTDFINVRLPDTSMRTRLILYTKGVLDKLDTIHVFVNHWPSKYGSGVFSDSRREAAAGSLKSYCDSLILINPRANILLMGDFNDSPERSAASAFTGFTNLAENLQRRIQRGKNYKDSDGIIPGKGSRYETVKGSIRFMGEWELIDHFLVSSNLLDPLEPIYCVPESMEIFSHAWLLENDRQYLGFMPRRTFKGPRYNGGLSDHLPIIMTIKKVW
jgi:predicted extracellular nuclease